MCVRLSVRDRGRTNALSSAARPHASYSRSERSGSPSRPRSHAERGNEGAGGGRHAGNSLVGLRASAAGRTLAKGVPFRAEHTRPSMPSRALAKWFRWSNTRQAWQERLGAAGLLLWLHAAAAPPWAKVLAWASLALVLAVFLRRGWLKLFGPVLFYDLVRSARRSRTFLVRTGYLSILLLVLCWMYLAWV